jgi:uncharacterized protein (DUF849 family)
MIFLQVALNGDRQHPAVPKTPAEIARDVREVVDAGAHGVHVHAFDENGKETLEARACALVLTAIRSECPGVPVSLTTSAAIIADPRERLATVRAWTELPDLVSVNQGEEGIIELSEWLLSRGVELEAGLLSIDDAKKLASSPIRDKFKRVLIEPLHTNPDEALRQAAEMEAIVVSAGITVGQVHHGYDLACWSVNRRALDRGHGIRTGLEDVAVLPDGRPAENNAQLVQAALEMIADQKS